MTHRRVETEAGTYELDPQPVRTSLTRPTKQVLIAISSPFWRMRTWNPQSIGGPSVSEVRTG